MEEPTKAKRSRRGICVKCGQDRGIIGRGACTTCYKTYVTIPISEGREAELPMLGNMVPTKANKEKLVSRYNCETKQAHTQGVSKVRLVDTIVPVSAEEVFWSHACWMCEKLGIPTDRMPAFEHNRMLNHYDTRLRISGVDMGNVHQLSLYSFAAFNQVHPLVEFLKTTIRREQLLKQARDLDARIDHLLKEFTNTNSEDSEDCNKELVV